MIANLKAGYTKEPLVPNFTSSAVWSKEGDWKSLMRLGKVELYLRARKASFSRFSRFPSFALNRKRGVSFFSAVP